MPTNRLLGAIDADETAAGALSWLASPTVIELCAEAGLDFVWIDLEHGGPPPTDTPALEHCARAADTAGIELVVRLPSAAPAAVRKVLDTGVRTLLIPRVDSARTVRRAVAASRFEYDDGSGDRGLAAVRANRWGARLDRYIDEADASVRVGVMIETRNALDELESILTVPNLGFAFIGPWDLSHALGHPLDTDHPDVTAAIADIESACRAAGVPLMGFSSDPTATDELVELGYRLFVVGSETAAISETFGNWVDRYGRSGARGRSSETAGGE